ncbi:hypothetical protein GYMLUDRAFT_1011415 [Collybiopsis luxurians FD-317 M1]|uniref:Unplaced genomic scaffold GYMLUscaffold_44, whole genome shotgun sequence n=1 Tax=Collybiopsis luxurians FD-317 M1 TaxID=944289 RepID=A0A0D0BQ03_9AGAR|nr:hypothetical protein GYMLUDRAFT_1011415 [Collybiopsis luxurians FD-317 M1]
MANPLPAPATLLVMGPDYIYGTLPVPPPPLQNPVSTADIMTAVELASQAMRFRGEFAIHDFLDSPNYVNDAAAGACVKYRDAVVALSNSLAAAPAWFVQWNNDTFNTLVQDVHDLTANMMIPIARNHNLRTVMDDNGPFQQVPFPNAVWPWGKSVAGPNGVQVVLPGLCNTQAVDQLTSAEASAYFMGYYPGIQIPHVVQQRKIAILRAIGRDV